MILFGPPARVAAQKYVYLHGVTHQINEVACLVHAGDNWAGRDKKNKKPVLVAC